MTDRSAILREIGLTPIWSLRGASGQAVNVQPEQQPAALAAVEVKVAQIKQTEQPHPNRAATIAAMSWEDLVASIAHCTACKLSETRNKTVPGIGDRAPAWMVISSAPDESEDRQGRPFVGEAGQLLDGMLAAVGKTRTQGVFITHVIKCHPPGNRVANPDEIKACAPYLQRQIALASPALLLAMGEISAQTILNRDEAVDTLRAGDGRFAGIPVVVTYHPSQLLAAPLEKCKAWDDLVRARTLIA